MEWKSPMENDWTVPIHLSGKVHIPAENYYQSIEIENIYVSVHARVRMQSRNVSIDEVYLALVLGIVKQGYGERFISILNIPRYGVYEVVYAISGGDVTVVTVIKTLVK